MKKIFSVIIVIVTLCFVVCGCSGRNDYSNQNNATNASVTSSEALQIAKSLCENECFNKASCSNGYFQYGTEDVSKTDDGDWYVSLHGYFYPKDSYGDYSNYKYRITYGVTVHSNGTYYIVYNNISKT